MKLYPVSAMGIFGNDRSDSTDHDLQEGGVQVWCPCWQCCHVVQPHPWSSPGDHDVLP